MPAAPSAPRHFSMIRGFHLADAFTLGNAACGVAGVLMAMRYLASHDVGDAARGVAERERVGQVEAADHREVSGC